MQRILAVDFGMRRVGLAVSDALGLTAQGLPTQKVSGPNRAVEVVVEASCQWQVGRIVVGMPLNMDGSKGDMARIVEFFIANLLEKTGLPVSEWDERLTSVYAHRVLQASGQKSRGQKGAIDRIAATLLLESYIESLS